MRGGGQLLYRGWSWQLPCRATPGSLMRASHGGGRPIIASHDIDWCATVTVDSKLMRWIKILLRDSFLLYYSWRCLMKEIVIDNRTGWDLLIWLWCFKMNMRICIRLSSTTCISVANKLCQCSRVVEVSLLCPYSSISSWRWPWQQLFAASLWTRYGFQFALKIELSKLLESWFCITTRMLTSKCFWLIELLWMELGTHGATQMGETLTSSRTSTHPIFILHLSSVLLAYQQIWMLRISWWNIYVNTSLSRLILHQLFSSN